MKRLAWIGTTLVLCFGLSVVSGSGQGADSSAALPVPDYVLDTIVQIQLTADGESRVVGSGILVRSDGLILLPYHLVKNAAAISVRLRNGETFDHAQIVANDERRNVAIIRIPGAHLTAFSQSVPEEGYVGAQVAVVTSTSSGGIQPAGIVSSVALADEIPGAGKGYRILKFTETPAGTQSGGLLIDERGRPLGVLAASPQSQNSNYAVPLSSLIGLIRSIGVSQAQWTGSDAPSTGQTKPFPIPQSSVSVPQRGVLPLTAKGPGSVVVKPSRPVDVLLASKTIYVNSYTENFEPDQLVNALATKPEMEAWGLSFVDEREVADLVLTLDHVLFTWKFTFKLAHQRTGVVVATGDVIIWDGNLGAGHMADRVIQKLKKVRAQTPTPPAEPEKKGMGKTNGGS